MIYYYRVFGLFANSALVINILIIISIMSLIPGATLTLPGIAGIVLTVGMAVDANVLIFERIKEEIKNGSTPLASIELGYKKAFSTKVTVSIFQLFIYTYIFSSLHSIFIIKSIVISFFKFLLWNVLKFIIFQSYRQLIFNLKPFISIFYLFLGYKKKSTQNLYF